MEEKMTENQNPFGIMFFIKKDKPEKPLAPMCYNGRDNIDEIQKCGLFYIVGDFGTEDFVRSVSFRTYIYWIPETHVVSLCHNVFLRQILDARKQTFDRKLFAVQSRIEWYEASTLSPEVWSNDKDVVELRDTSLNMSLEKYSFIETMDPKIEIIGLFLSHPNNNLHVFVRSADKLTISYCTFNEDNNQCIDDNFKVLIDCRKPTSKDISLSLIIYVTICCLLVIALTVIVCYICHLRQTRQYMSLEKVNQLPSSSYAMVTVDTINSETGLPTGMKTLLSLDMHSLIESIEGHKQSKIPTQTSKTETDPKQVTIDEQPSVKPIDETSTKQ